MFEISDLTCKVIIGRNFKKTSVHILFVIFFKENLGLGVLTFA